MSGQHEGLPASIPALLPRGAGHQFVLYGDACSGIPGALHERNFAAVNAVLRRLAPQPEFILFPGDEIIGLTADAESLRAQWRHWLDREMGWLDRRTIPIWHTTGNHTAYDEMSEAVFRDVLGLPRNGPPGQEGVSYWVRRGDLLMVFVHTLWTGLGGEGHVETDWLRRVLGQHADARHKLVVGHHPVIRSTASPGRGSARSGRSTRRNSGASWSRPVCSPMSVATSWPMTCRCMVACCSSARQVLARPTACLRVWSTSTASRLPWMVKASAARCWTRTGVSASGCTGRRHRSRRRRGASCQRETAPRR
jgi:hypothetical protein